MELKKITAIVRRNQLEAVENRLKDLPGLIVDDVRGYRECVSCFARNWMTRYARIELVVDARRVPGIADAISDVLNTGAGGDGVVYAVPVDLVYRTRDHHLERSVSSCPRCRAAARLRRRRRRTNPSVRQRTKVARPS